MTVEAKESLEQIQKGLHDFKATNQKALGEKADKGYVDSSLKETSEKIESAVFGKIDDFNKEAKKRFDDLEGKLDILNLTGTGGSTSDLVAEADMFSKWTGQTVTAEQVKAYKAAQDHYWRYGDGRQALRQGGVTELSAAMSVGSDPAGGYWVDPAMSNKLATKIFESSPIRQIANVETIGTDALEGAKDLEEASTGWVGETEARTETSTPTVGEWRIPVFEQYAMPKTTQKLLDDASRDVGAWLTNKVSGKMARTENTAFLVGDGDKKPRGLMTPTFVSTADATRAWGEVQFIGTGVSADFPAAPAGWNIFIDTIAAVKAPYRQNAKWVMNRSTLAASMKEQDSNGQYFWTSDLTSNGFGFRVLNFPVVEAEDMADIAANSLSIAFGNFQEAYTIVDRAGIVVLRDPFTDKPHVLFYTTKRVGGDVVNFEAYKAIKFI